MHCTVLNVEWQIDSFDRHMIRDIYHQKAESIQIKYTEQTK